MKSQQLIESYQQQQQKKVDEREVLLKAVTVKAWELFGEGLPLWLGEFLDELQLNKEKAEAKYLGDQNDVSAYLSMPVTWNGIDGNIYFDLQERPLNYRHKVNAKLVFVFPGLPYAYGVSQFYEKKEEIELPNEACNFAETQPWSFPKAIGPVPDDKLAKLLVDLIQIKSALEMRKVEVEKRRRSERLTDFSNRFHWSKNRNEAAEILAQAIAEYPELESQWQEHYQAEIAEFEKSEKKEEIFAKQVEAYKGFIGQYVSAMEEQRCAMSELQAEYEKQDVVWKLSYAVRACDEDSGEDFTETSSIYVRDAISDVSGFYNRIDRDHLIPAKYFYPVSIEPVQAALISVPSCHYSISTPVLFKSVLFPYYIPKEQAELEVNEALGKCPSIPKCPTPELAFIEAGLDSDDAFRQAAREGLKESDLWSHIWGLYHQSFSQNRQEL